MLEITGIPHGQKPQAIAKIKGSDRYKGIIGTVCFYSVRHGVCVVAEVFGLPTDINPCGGKFFGFHLHSGGECIGNGKDPFSKVLGHYNPNGCAHPYHAGDMPPLLGCNGYAFSAFVTNRFSVKELADKAVIIHSNPDDFTTDPSGNSGEKIACGSVVLL